MMPMKQTPVGFRRNGKKQACEPCRKGKLACDHGTPFCGRCTRRQTTLKCIYHPAPMTKAPRKDSQDSAQRESVSSEGSGQLHSPRTIGSSSHASRPTTQQDGSESGLADSSDLFIPKTEDEVIRNAMIGLGRPKTGWQYLVFPSSAKYYGPTSFAAIFSENQTKLNEDSLDIRENSRKHPGAWPFGQPLLGRTRPNAPTSRERQTFLALWNIPTREICDVLLSPPGLSVRSLSLMILRRCVASLWSAFEAEMNAPRTADSLLIVSDAMFKNEELPLPEPPENGYEWLDTFMGVNIRFETMGLLFCYLGIGYLSLQDWDPVFKVPENHERDRKQTAWRMKECADICLQMCDYSETINYLVTALIYNLKRLESGCTGDDTYKMRRHHGDMVTTAITVGLHRLPEYGTIKVTAASEYKRRLFCGIYSSDKTHASLNGTPPLLTRLYCDVQPCLDLPDETLFLPLDQLALAVSKLDVNGWNTERDMEKDTYQATTILRAKLQLSIVREDILALALGVHVEVSEAKIIDLHQRCQQSFDSLPTALRYYDSKGVPKNSTGGLLYDQSHILLHHLQNKFLIDRFAIAKGLAHGQGLLETALAMIDISLTFWMKRDQLMSFSFNFDWLITYYGIPSAGVICLELLKTSTGQSTVHMSRSLAIQQMTLFIAFLDWIRPTDGNFDLAQRLRKVIGRVMDHVLEPSQEQPAETKGMEIPYDPMFPDFGGNDLDWLNTIDWTQGSWMEFS